MTLEVLICIWMFSFYLFRYQDKALSTCRRDAQKYAPRGRHQCTPYCSQVRMLTAQALWRHALLFSSSVLTDANSFGKSLLFVANTTACLCLTSLIFYYFTQCVCFSVLFWFCDLLRVNWYFIVLLFATLTLLMWSLTGIECLCCPAADTE